MITSLALLGRAVRVAWVAWMVVLLLVVALPHLLPAFDRQLFIVRGASMEPAVPMGAVIIVEQAEAERVSAGDVITFRAGSGTVITHRVLSVEPGKEVSYWTKGDASNGVDPRVVTETALIGRVEYVVPALGQAMVVLSSGAGTFVGIGLLASLLLLAWFIDELVAVLSRARGRRALAHSAG